MLKTAAMVLFLFQPAHAFEDVLTAKAIQGALESTKINEIFDKYLATIQMFDPERATLLGTHGADALLTRKTQKRVNVQLEAFKKLRGNLGKIKQDSLSSELQIDYDLLDHMLEVDIYRMEHLDRLKKRPQDYLSPLFSIHELLTKDFDNYGVRASNALERMKQFPNILMEAERNISNPPKIWAQEAILQTKDAINTVYEFVPLFKAYTRYDPLLRTSLNETVGKVRASLERYLDFLQTEILPVANGDFRVGSYTYGFYLERWHGLNRTPGSAYRYAKKAFNRSLAEFKREAGNIDPILFEAEGWLSVLKKLPKDHPETDDITAAFQNELERAYQHFDEFKVVQFPKQRLLIKKMPGFLKSVKPYVYYNYPFALDSSRVSELYIRVPSRKLPKKILSKILERGYNYTVIELLTAYSLMPGLHLQSYESAGDSSKIRKVSFQPFVQQGWGCYSEILAGEMGFYSSYWAQFMLSYIKTLRAARAFVDAALHQKKMEYSDAVKFFKDKMLFSAGQSRAEVLRISNTPTESLGYVLATENILKMRKYYERAEEKYFDLRKFHTQFLREGNIPIDNISRELRRKRKAAEKIIR